jgi:hypothetical protein
MRINSALRTPHLEGLSRRELFRLSAAGILGCSVSPWLQAFAEDAASNPQRRRSCILLWMNGGPSQMDTFDLKPGNENGGTFKEIETSVSGIKISEHLPKLAKQMQDIAIIRSMSTKEGDHGRATQYCHSGYVPQGAIRYPTFGSLVSKELGQRESELPSFVSIAPYRALAPAAYAPGFLGSQYAPLLVGENAGQQTDGKYDLKVADLEHPTKLASTTIDSRLSLMNSLNKRFLSEHEQPVAASYKSAYERAVKLMRSDAAKAFNLDDEPAAVRDAYGRSPFGQGCLLARRLVERGVPFVEVTLGGLTDNGLGWDTHAENFDGVRKLSEVLDPAWATLMNELRDRGLLESTLIVWMGEFGRTPKINPSGGRDHYPQAWSTVLAGGGIHGGQAYGRTSADGTTVEDKPVTIPDLLATVCTALGIDPMNQNDSNVGRPIRVVDPAAKPIKEIAG